MSIEMEISLKDAQLIAGLLRAAGGQKKVTDEVEKTTAASKKAEAELDRMAKAVTKMTTTPLEKYNAELVKLADLHKKGKISTETHTRAIEQQRRELDKSVITAREIGTAGKASILDMAGSLGLITTVSGAAAAGVNLITQALRFAKEEAKSAVEAMKGLVDQDSRLLQVSKSGDDFAALKSRADTAAEKYGIDRGTAREMLFSARSEGWEADYEKIVASHQVVAGKSAASVAGQIPGLFSASGQKLGREEAVNLTLKAAEQSRLPFESLASAMVAGAETSAPAGASPEELAAVTSVLASRFKSGETAGDRIKAFGGMVAMQPGLRGKGLMGGFQALKAMPAEDRKKMLGESLERNAVYDAMVADEQQIAAMHQGLLGEKKAFAGGGGVLRDRIGIAAVDPEMRANREINRQANALEVTKKQLINEGARDQIGLAKAQQVQLQLGNTGLQRGLGSLAAGGANFAGVNNAGTLTGISVAAGNAPEGLILSAFGQFGQAVALFRAAAIDLKAAANKKQPNHRAAQVEAAAPIN